MVLKMRKETEREWGVAHDTNKFCPGSCPKKATRYPFLSPGTLVFFKKFFVRKSYPYYVQSAAGIISGIPYLHDNKLLRPQGPP